jgi:hypothetical protein
VSARNRMITLGLALLVALTTAGCSYGDTTGTDVNSKIDAAEVRTDRDPIATRFPRLGAFTDVRWAGGTLGDDRVPGPSTYFIEAVVNLAPDDVARLSGEYELSPAAALPQAPQSLAPFLEGSGAWATSDELEAGFGSQDWASDVFVRLDDGVAYVSARGE